MGNVNILEKRMIKYEVSVKQTAKFIMMLLILSPQKRYSRYLQFQKKH